MYRAPQSSLGVIRVYAVPILLMIAQSPHTPRCKKDSTEVETGSGGAQLPQDMQEPFLTTGEFFLHSHLYHTSTHIYGGTIPAYN